MIPVKNDDEGGTWYLGSRKEFALKAIEDSKTNKLLSPSVLFLMYDGKKKEVFDLIWKSIRPTGNHL